MIVQCGCGKQFKVKDEHAGRRGRCSECGSPVLFQPAGHHPAAHQSHARSLRQSPPAEQVDDLEVIDSGDQTYDADFDALAAAQSGTPVAPSPLRLCTPTRVIFVPVPRLSSSARRRQSA